MDGERKIPKTGPLKDIPNGPIPGYPRPGQRTTAKALWDIPKGAKPGWETEEEEAAAIERWANLPDVDKRILLLEYSNERMRQERLSRIP